MTSVEETLIGARPALRLSKHRTAAGHVGSLQKCPSRPGSTSDPVTPVPTHIITQSSSPLALRSLPHASDPMPTPLIPLPLGPFQLFQLDPYPCQLLQAFPFLQFAVVHQSFEVLVELVAVY